MTLREPGDGDAEVVRVVFVDVVDEIDGSMETAGCSFPLGCAESRIAP